MSLYDRQMQLLEMSDAWRKMYELTENDVGQIHYDTFPNLPQHWIEAHQTALRGKKSEHIEEPYRLANGAVGWHKWQCLPWFSPEGEIKGLLISAEDVTKRKERELELNKVLARFELIQQAAQIGMWDWDVQDENITLNAEYYEILGWKKNHQISNDDFYDLIHPEDLSRAKNGMNKALRGYGKYEEEFRIYRANDGKLRWVKDKGQVEFDEKGYPSRVYGAIIDITAQKILTNEHLKSAGEEYNKFLDSILEGIWSVDRNGITTYVNEAITKMLGYSEEEMIGSSLFGYMDDEWRKIALDKFSQRSDGLSERHEFLFRCKDSSSIWCLLGANPIFENGRFVGSVAVIMDYSERKKVEEAKDKRIAELERLLALKK